MTAYSTSRLYETNQMSNSAADALATREMSRSRVEASTACLICREEVKMIVAEKAAAICQCSRRKIYRWIEERDRRFVEMPDGEVMVCGRSLSQKMDDLDSNTDRLSQGKAAANR